MQVVSGLMYIYFSLNINIRTKKIIELIIAIFKINEKDPIKDCRFSTQKSIVQPKKAI